METITILASIATIIGTVLAIFFGIKKNKYAVYIKIDRDMIKSDRDLKEIKKNINQLINIDSDFNIKIVNNKKLRINLANKDNYSSFLKKNKIIEKTDSRIENIFIEPDKTPNLPVKSNDSYFESKASSQTPFIYINKSTGDIQFKGNSLPEDITSFYGPVINYLQEFKKAELTKITANFEFAYFNTSSSKKLLEIFKMLKQFEDDGIPTIINWYYLLEDEDMEDAGEDFKNLLKFKHFNVVGLPG